MIFECNTQSQSDYKYARSLMKKYFKIDEFKFEKIFAGSKSKLYAHSTERKVELIKKKYKDKNPNFKILFFADADTNDNEDAAINNKLVGFANQYVGISDIVWSNYDIEHVFLGKRISKNKPKEADNFLIGNKIKGVDINLLKESNPLSKKPSSNMYLVFSSIFPKK